MTDVCADRPARDEVRQPRVWVLTNLPSPYQVELLTAVADGGEVALQTRFMRPAADPTMLARLPHRILSGLAPRWFRDELRLHPRAVWECLFGEFDCYVLSGLTSSVTFLLCAVCLWLRGAAWCVWLERPRAAGATWSSPGLSFRPLRWVRCQVMRWVLSRTQRVIGIGTAAADEYHALGVPRSKLGILPYCCNVERFARPDAVRVAEIRQRYGLQGRTVLLYSGQMIERKGVDCLLRTFADVAGDRPEAALLLLGDGKLRPELERSVPEAIQGRVHFAGHVLQAELPAYFGIADVFVFPSRHDGWGVVLNEACAAGLPIIATRQTGAARDLVAEGENGYCVERDDASGLGARMRELLDDPAKRRAFGARSRELVEPFTLTNGANTFCEQVACMIGTGLEACVHPDLLYGTVMPEQR